MMCGANGSGWVGSGDRCEPYARVTGPAWRAARVDQRRLRLPRAGHDRFDPCVSVVGQPWCAARMDQSEPPCRPCRVIFSTSTSAWSRAPCRASRPDRRGMIVATSAAALLPGRSGTARADLAAASGASRTRSRPARSWCAARSDHDGALAASSASSASSARYEGASAT